MSSHDDRDAPIVAAVAADLDEWTGRLTLPELREYARQAVEAHRRAVLDQRDDGERWAILSTLAERSPNGVLATEAGALLAALADAEIARRQAEAERDDQVERATEAHVLADQMRRERDAMGRPAGDMLAAYAVTARDQERHAANGGTA